MDYIKYSIANLALHNFRNHRDCFFEFSNHCNLITGSNGSGKTSILEAISLLSLGRGIKGSDTFEMLTYNQRFGKIATNLDSQIGRVDLSCILEYDSQVQKVKKKYFLDEKALNNRNNKISYINCIWLIPQMDNFFLQDSAVKRKFIDRMISQIDTDYMKRLIDYDKLLKERNKLLANYDNNKWLSIIEEQLAPLGVSICASRISFVSRLNEYVQENAKYPLQLSFNGKLEELFDNFKYSLIVEKEYLKLLFSSRERDKMTGVCEIGAHRSKLEATSLLYNQKVDNCSTGEQKIMLIIILIAYIKLVFKLENIKPILLLDEINIHLDNHNTNVILKDLFDLGNQIFISAIDDVSFNNFKDIMFNIQL
jgi:DNA replication and repair protein RecF